MKTEKNVVIGMLSPSIIIIAILTSANTADSIEVANQHVHTYFPLNRTVVSPTLMVTILIPNAINKTIVPAKNMNPFGT